MPHLFMLIISHFLSKIHADGSMESRNAVEMREKSCQLKRENEISITLRFHEVMGEPDHGEESA